MLLLFYLCFPDVRSSGAQADVELEVEDVALAIGELAGQLSVLDSSELRSYCVIQLCILLRLLAGTGSEHVCTAMTLTLALTLALTLSLLNTHDLCSLRPRCL